MIIFTLIKYWRKHRLCFLMALSILFDNCNHHINIQHLDELLLCGLLNFVLMWLHNSTDNRNILYLHGPLTCATWNQIFHSFSNHTGITSLRNPQCVLFLGSPKYLTPSWTTPLWVYKLVCTMNRWSQWLQKSWPPSWTTTSF